MGDRLVLYMASTSGNQLIKKQQQHIGMVLDGKHIEYEKIDITLVDGAKEKMRELVGDSTALPPRLCRGDTYLGGAAEFDEAIENEDLNAFLKL